jgi:hypothetical protein
MHYSAQASRSRNTAVEGREPEFCAFARKLSMEDIVALADVVMRENSIPFALSKETIARLHQPKRTKSLHKVQVQNQCQRTRGPELLRARTEAWEYLRDGLRADLALVQEASPPPGLRSVYRPIDERNPRLNWGSAVVALHPDVSLHPRTRVPLADCSLKVPATGEVPDSHAGACAVADVSLASGQFSFTAMSLYGQWEETPGGGTIYACARLHRMISDLTGVFASCRRSGVVVAGDLNITTQVAFEGQTQVDTDGAAAVFARLRAWGLTDCLD